VTAKIAVLRHSPIFKRSFKVGCRISALFGLARAALVGFGRRARGEKIDTGEACVSATGPLSLPVVRSTPQPPFRQTDILPPFGLTALEAAHISVAT
jgi:hypothetical protein